MRKAASHRSLSAALCWFHASPRFFPVTLRSPQRFFPVTLRWLRNGV